MATNSYTNMETANFRGLILAQVLDNKDPMNQRRIKVYIPKISNKKSSSVNDKPVTTKCINKDEYGTTSSVKHSEGYWAKPTYYSVQGHGRFRLPKINQYIIVFFLDEDPNKLYYTEIYPMIDESYNVSSPKLDDSMDVISSNSNGDILYIDEQSRNLKTIIGNSNTTMTVDNINNTVGASSLDMNESGNIGMEGTSLLMSGTGANMSINNGEGKECN